MESNVKTLDNILLDNYLITGPMPAGDMTYDILQKLAP